MPLLLDSVGGWASGRESNVYKFFTSSYHRFYKIQNAETEAETKSKTSLLVFV